MQHLEGTVCALLEQHDCCLCLLCLAPGVVGPGDCQIAKPSLESYWQLGLAEATGALWLVYAEDCAAL